MTEKNVMKKWGNWQSHCIMLALFALCFVSCEDKDDEKKSAKPFNPSQPVLITGFEPDSGGLGQRLVIYGQNFGNDPSAIQVFVGEKEARVIGVEGENLYCLVPRRAYGGNIEIHVGDKANPTVATTDKIFKYLQQTIVSTVMGYKTERDDQGWKDGKFKDADESNMASGFAQDGFLKFDPANSKHLWATFDNHNGLYLINFEDSTVKRTRADLHRPRSIDFSLDKQWMILSEDRTNENETSNYIMSREDDFKARKVLTQYKQCNGSVVHPKNGELYFNSYDKGQFFRFDLQKYLDPREPSPGVKDYETIFNVHDPQWEYRIIIHPSGKYAYIMVINQHYILRTLYNESTQRFMQPSIVCGELRRAGWVDGVGTSALLDRPYQGVFVKNAKYESEGREDVYDFYFTDCNNHCVRKLTYEGAVTTFAGRGSASLNADPFGYVDGDARQEARFQNPSGIVYNEEEAAFYISDRENRRIRKIEKDEE